MKTYAEAEALLIERVRLMHRSDWSPTPGRAAALAFVDRLRELADDLDSTGSIQFDIEAMHDRSAEAMTGPDGWPVPAPEVGASFKATLWHMRTLAESAQAVADGLPDPRERPALPFAALVYLHLRYQHGLPRPTAYNDGEGVRELKRIADAAGLVRSPAAVRGVLKAALDEFDPHHVPEYVREFLR
jgi:hypothetical protein